MSSYMKAFAWGQNKPKQLLGIPVHLEIKYEAWKYKCYQGFSKIFWTQLETLAKSLHVDWRLGNWSPEIER